jgi:predicted transcriptional regulator
MTQLTLQLPDDVFARLQDEAERRKVTLDVMVSTALERYWDEDGDLTEEEILASMRTAMEQALAGNYRPAHEVLDEIEAEEDDDADEG